MNIVSHILKWGRQIQKVEWADQSQKIRHKETESQFYVLLWILAHIYYMLKTARPLGLAQNGFGELQASQESGFLTL